MRKLRHKKAHGIDELPPNFLKDVANEISKPFSFIINKFLSSCVDPSLCKISKVTPRYKSDSKSAINVQYLFYRDDDDDDDDDGLLRGVIYLDSSKAFDTVSHSYLLSNLPSYGISRNEFTWFENYLFNRNQHVFYDGHLSKAFPSFRGVPQGSILGPTLFLLHLDDIDDCLRHSSITKYADDTVIYVRGNDSESVQKKLMRIFLKFITG